MKSNWYETVKVEDIPENTGVSVKLERWQVAIFNFKSMGQVFATQNLCPHKKQMVLSRGMLGDSKGEPKVACPFHKRTFSLQSGACLTDSECTIETYPVKVEKGVVYVNL